METTQYEVRDVNGPHPAPSGLPEKAKRPLLPEGAVRSPGRPRDSGGFLFRLILGWFCLASWGSALGQVPALLNFQGRVLLDGAPFNGQGQFKFALLDTNDVSAAFWRNAPDANTDGEPDASVSVPVDHGLFSVDLGDTSLPNMAALPPEAFGNPNVHLRTWFNDGTSGFQRLEQDRRVVAAGYSLMAASVADGSVSLPKLAPDLAAAFGDFNARLTALSNRLESVNQSNVPRGATFASSDPADPDLVAGGLSRTITVPSPAWVNGSSSGIPSPRYGHTAVWTGQEMIVWGGALGSSFHSSTGGRYRPDLDTWQAVSTVGAPSGRAGHTAVWTGSGMLVWGGFSGSAYLDTGGIYSVDHQRWESVSTVGAPSARDGHVALWTGGRMVVWGGRNTTGKLADGALYDPVARLWSALPALDAPEPRAGAIAVWAEDRLLIWGGEGTNGFVRTGGQLLFANGVPTEWRASTLDGAPTARGGHSAVWTGSRMLVWGGSTLGIYQPQGAAYDPIADTWTPISDADAPTLRAQHNAVWTGTEMLVVAGQTAGGATATGAAYDPATDRWRVLGNPGSPQPRSEATAVWTGAEAILFGGRNDRTPLAALQRLTPQPTWYFYRKP